jgi:hypothetical protein
MEGRDCYGVVRCVARPPLSWLVLSPVALYFRFYKRFFPQHYEARRLRTEASVKAYSDWIEANDPALFERVTGRKARPSAEIPQTYGD